MRYRWFIILTLACLALAWFARPGQVISQQNQFVYLPTLAKPEEPTCAIPGSSYNTLAVLPPPTDRPAALHPDLNLAIRGYEPVVADLNLVTYAGGNDTNAPNCAGSSPMAACLTSAPPTRSTAGIGSAIAAASCTAAGLPPCWAWPPRPAKRSMCPIAGIILVAGMMCWCCMPARSASP